MTARYTQTWFVIAIMACVVVFSGIFASDTNASQLSAKTTAGFEGPKSGKEGAYICTERKCGGFSVVVYQDDRLSRLARKEFERAQKDRKRFDRYFDLGFKVGNAFSRTKIDLQGTSKALKIGKQTGIGQAIKFRGKNDSGLEHGYVVLLPVEKRQHTFAAIAETPSKARSLALRFAKGLRF